MNYEKIGILALLIALFAVSATSIVVTTSGNDNSKVNKSGDIMTGDLVFGKYIGIHNISHIENPNYTTTIYNRYNTTLSTGIVLDSLTNHPTLKLSVNNQSDSSIFLMDEYYSKLYHPLQLPDLNVSQNLCTDASRFVVSCNTSIISDNTKLNKTENTTTIIINSTNTIKFNFDNTSGSPDGEAMRFSGFGRYAFVRKAPSVAANAFALSTFILDCGFSNQCQNGAGGSMLFGIMNSSSEALRYMGRVSMTTANTTRNDKYNLSFAVRQNDADVNALQEVLRVSSSGNMNLIAGNFTMKNPSSCITMYSPNGSPFRLEVNNLGTFTTLPGACS